MNDDDMIYSAIECPDGHILESLHRHMYVTHTDKTNGKHYMLDGGNDYIRCSINGDEKHIILYSYSPIEQVREKLKRWNNKEKKWVLLKDISNDWLEAILKDYLNDTYQMENKFLIQYIKEKQFRNEQDV